MKLPISRYIYSIYFRASGKVWFPGLDSYNVGSVKMNNTEKTLHQISGVLYSFSWIISPLFDQFPCLGDIFHAKLF